MSEDTTNADAEPIPHPAGAPRRVGGDTGHRHGHPDTDADADQPDTDHRVTGRDRSRSGRSGKSRRRGRQCGGWARGHRRRHRHRRRRVDWDDIDQLERHQRNLEQRAADIAARIDGIRARIRELAERR